MVRVHYSNSGKLALGDIAADFGLARLVLVIDLSIFLRSQVERDICWLSIRSIRGSVLLAIILIQPVINRSSVTKTVNNANDYRAKLARNLPFISVLSRVAERTKLNV